MQILYISKKNLRIMSIFFIVFIILLLFGYQYFKNQIHIDAFKYQGNYFNNKTIVIDAGHGGIDSGVMHSSGLMEKDVNLHIAKQLKELLDESGANCIITRDKDEELSHLSTIGGTRHRKDLNARVNIIDSNNSDLFISIHVNSFPQDEKVKGPIVFYYTHSEYSKGLAECIQERLNIEYNKQYKVKQTSLNKARGDSFYLLKNTRSPGVIVEIGFMSNNEDYSLIKKEKFRYLVAYQIYIALGEFLNQ
jgi:N-acetylmuramoyl-L-alanine amidase